MTSVYTELTKEAAKRGGPAALRAFYRWQGALIGGAAVAGVSIAGTRLYSKVRARGSDTTAAPASGPDRENGTGAPAPGEEDDA